MSCEASCHYEQMSDDGGLCLDCAARAQAEIDAERAADFCFMAKGWLTRELAQKPLHVLVDERDAQSRAA